MDKEGNIDISYIEEVVSRCKNQKCFILKSTITPEAIKKLRDAYCAQIFISNPEFLTERTAVEDFKNPSRIVIGGPPLPRDKVYKIYKKVFPTAPYILTDAKTACFIKYFCNCFFASKISLINEFKQIADAEDINWDQAMEGLLSSGWVNPMHTQTPGHDGKRGFGGKCFPKDLNAFINYAKLTGTQPLILESSWEKNLEVRSNKDWLKIIGAVNNK